MSVSGLAITRLREAVAALPRIAVLASLLLAAGLRPANGQEAQTLQVPAFELPAYSDLLSAETRAGIERSAELQTRARALCNPYERTTGREIRACEARYYQPIMEEARRIYDVEIRAQRIGGVQVDVVTPAGGVPSVNAHRVLINIHGGSFMYGARFGGQIEAMPLAAIGGYRVVTVDYRMGPDHRYPAASEDIASVYRALLSEYDPANIGIYGCSAGARIAGQALAWFESHDLPRPGAVGFLCSTPTRFGGDSNIIAMALRGLPPRTRDFTQGYFQGVNPDDPIAFPGDNDTTAANFPPTLLMGSTRDYTLSPMLNMHARLVRLGVPTELHVYEGLGHGEFLNMYIPEAHQAARVVAHFFDAQLGSARPKRSSAR